MSAFDFFDDIKCIHHTARTKRWPVMQSRFKQLGIEERVGCFPAWPSPADGRIGRAMSHRRVIQDAAERGLRSVLVIEDETLFLDTADALLAPALRELRATEWKLLHLAAPFGSDDLDEVEECRHLRKADSAIVAHALAYARPVYEELLDLLPMNFNAMEKFLGDTKTLEDILSKITPAFMVHPALATVPVSLPYQSPEAQFRFVA